ncbi:hypothetical protein AB0911_38585 [Streptomyces nigra]|uniref:hypothetical protein n=1 Tax=Streptomyces nigra TaxID=1827580 RepID=UPI003454B9FF
MIPQRVVARFELPSANYDSVDKLRAAIAGKIAEAVGEERQVSVSFFNDEVSTNTVISSLLCLSVSRCMASLVAYNEGLHATLNAKMPPYVAELHQKKSLFREEGFQAYENQIISEMAAALRVPEGLLHAAHTQLCVAIADTSGYNAIPGNTQTPTISPEVIPEFARELIPEFSSGKEMRIVRVGKTFGQIITAALCFTAAVRNVWAESDRSSQSGLSLSSSSGSNVRLSMAHAAVLSQNDYRSKSHQGEGADKIQHEPGASTGPWRASPVSMSGPRR